jgi:hypothetical protein
MADRPSLSRSNGRFHGLTSVLAESTLAQPQAIKNPKKKVMCARRARILSCRWLRSVSTLFISA